MPTHFLTLERYSLLTYLFLSLRQKYKNVLNLHVPMKQSKINPSTAPRDWSYTTGEIEAQFQFQAWLPKKTSASSSLTNDIQ